MDKVFIDMLRKRSREIAPDYPKIMEDLELWEHLWAITSSYEGTKLANDDCHEMIAFLCQQLDWAPHYALDKFRGSRGM